ncbi:acyl-CoA dehydrogenase family protein [Streptacidiphilus fuscans]|uniref:glutaryl-CoA dehydrogenase (ETF) n=1 Tax=Streptacidiphilus fuscans TaxID=2789292 RepID=A0A931B2D8_9ACTN|nr:acyl-CoA dehydrogenase family protein [Streptacidiphilus fuscans]MBF9067696.1 acyl-CoA dehydrogenase family protein [Streptacidiphilus fuscans]
MTQTRDAASDTVDLLAVDDELSEADRDIRDTVRSFARTELAPYITEWFDAGGMPRELVKRMGELGLLGMHLEGYDCAGTTATSYGVACRELEAIDSGIRSFVSTQGSLAMYAIHRWGSEEQKQQWLPLMAAGDAVGCFGLTEPDAGSDPSAMRTTARRHGTDWVIDGSKMWITNGPMADVAVIWAQTDAGQGARGIRGFVVPTDTPGFNVQDVRGKLSLRASATGELVFGSLRLPADAMLPEAAGLGGPLSCLSEARYGIIWGVVGAARSCLETALDYAHHRTQFGRPIAGFQLTQQKLAAMTLALTQAGLLAARLGRLKDAGELQPTQISVGKLANVRTALDIARTARTILGGSGITQDYPVFRHMVNLETVLTYEGTEEMHVLSIGKALTGLAAFR